MRFQSTLPRGERLFCYRAVLDCKNFNPRSHEGSDYGDVVIDYDAEDFNPRSHEGSDDSFKLALDRYMDFNPRSHEGSDKNGRIKDTRKK